MQIPNYLHAHAAQVLGVELDAAIASHQASVRRSYWAVVLGLAPYRDGNRWCVLLGPDIQSGVAGFGKTPELAIQAFESAMGEEAGKAKI